VVEKIERVISFLVLTRLAISRLIRDEIGLYVSVLFFAPLVVLHLTIFGTLVLSSAPGLGIKLFDARFYEASISYWLILNM